MYPNNKIINTTQHTTLEQMEIAEQSQTHNTIWEQYQTMIKSLEESDRVTFGGSYDKYYEIFVDVFVNGNLDVDLCFLDNMTDNEISGIGMRYDLIGLYYHWIIQDYEKAINYWLKSIDLGTVYSMNNLGLYYSMIGTNNELAEYYFSLAIEKGYGKAMYNLGVHYAQIMKDYVQAERFFQMALEHGYTRACFTLASFYYMDVHNYGLAEDYYKKAIELGDHDALNNYGVYCATVKRDYTQASKYFIMGCDYGDDSCYENLLIFVGNVDCFEILEEIFACIIEHGNIHRVRTLVSINIESFVKWKVLVKMICLCDGTVKQIVLDAINTLENDQRVCGQIQNFKSQWVRAQKIDICPICLEADLLIINLGLGCDHGICYRCWKPFVRCFYRCNLHMNTHMS